MPVSPSNLKAYCAPEPEARFFNLVEKTDLKRDEQVLEREEGWYSEAEMKNDLNWSPQHPYTNMLQPL